MRVVRIVDTLAGLDLRDGRAVAAYWASDLLQDCYFGPKRLAGEMAGTVQSDPAFAKHLDATASFVEVRDLVATCEELLASFERDTGHPLPSGTLYLILGCATTTIYTARVAGEDASMLCVESLDGSLDTLRMYLAHEFTHWVRKALRGGDIFESCVGERLVTEGIAENYSREQVPGQCDETYCIVNAETVQWVHEHRALMDELVEGALDDTSLMEGLFWMYAPIDYPVRTGYVYGYDRVRQYLETRGLHVRDILGIDWQDVLA